MRIRDWSSDVCSSDLALQEEMRRYRGMGYEVVKMKIGGAPLEDDIARIEAVPEVVGEGKYLAVDANARFDLETANRYAEAMAPSKLFWYAAAGDPLDYALQAAPARPYAGPMATGQNLVRSAERRVGKEVVRT